MKMEVDKKTFFNPWISDFFQEISPVTSIETKFAFALEITQLKISKRVFCSDINFFCVYVKISDLKE